MCLYGVCSLILTRTTYHSNVGVRLRKQATWDPSTLWYGSHGVPNPKSQVPLMSTSSNMETCEVPTLEPHEVFKSFWLIYATKKTHDLCGELGLAFCLTQPSTQVFSFTSRKCWHVRHPCHTWDWGPHLKWQIPNFHALIGWECMDWPQVNWDLELGTMWTKLKHA